MKDLNRQLTIDGFEISDQSDCYVIAEIGHNHQGKVETCKEMFKAAKECGANAVKLQKRDNKSLFTADYYNKPYNSENAYGSTYGLHREALEFGKAEYIELQAYAKSLGITFFSTAFDFKSADFLIELGMPAFKMASGDLKNIPLLKYVAAMGKPMVISTGGGTFEDAQRAIEAILPINSKLAILQCTAAYPVNFEDMNLRVIETFRKAFPTVTVGLSAHDNGIAMAVAAYVLGARVVEKHFTLNRSWKGTDHAFSLEREGMRKMVRDLRRCKLALGDGIKRQLPGEEQPLIKMGKKLVAARALTEGTQLRAEDIAIKSPGDGTQPYDFEKFVGKTLRKNLGPDENLTFDVVRD